MNKQFSLDTFFASKPVMLAPMAGVNDPVFRSLCKRKGAALTYTEMISAKGLSYGNLKTETMLAYLDEEVPFAVQLFGTEPETMAAMATELEERLGDKLALIDVNMGCPARKVANKGGGAALMSEPKLAFAILAAIVAAVHVPVTVKFRKGFELSDNSAVEFARGAQAAGVAAVAVHGRTARQYYHGEADRSIIEQVVAAVDIPVIASGDVYTPADIADYFDSGATGVMVARGAQGNPWIFEQWAEQWAEQRAEQWANGHTNEPSLKQRMEVAWEHACKLAEFDPQKLVSMRRHFAWYFKGVPHAASLRRKLTSCVKLEDYKELLELLEQAQNDTEQVVRHA
ncbi:MAG: tRNA dihydrouridine synthase DusB [Coriobacteriia bacterium]|nr:tRNA dihydrouridine synthase DusB [Coriobacteriia bacterium]